MNVETYWSSSSRRRTLTLPTCKFKRNHGSCGVDGLSTEELCDYLKGHKDELVESLKSGSYRPNPVRRVEIPKGGGKNRPLGIPTVVDRLIQQAHQPNTESHL